MKWNDTKFQIKKKYAFFSYSSIALHETILHRVTGC